MDFINNFKDIIFFSTTIKLKVVVIGDLLVSNVMHYLKIWRKYFINHETLNFGIARDKVKKPLVKSK